MEISTMSADNNVRLIKEDEAHIYSNVVSQALAYQVDPGATLTTKDAVMLALQHELNVVLGEKNSAIKKTVYKLIPENIHKLKRIAHYFSQAVLLLEGEEQEEEFSLLDKGLRILMFMSADKKDEPLSKESIKAVYELAAMMEENKHNILPNSLIKHHSFWCLRSVKTEYASNPARIDQNKRKSPARYSRTDYLGDYNQIAKFETMIDAIPELLIRMDGLTTASYSRGLSTTNDKVTVIVSFPGKLSTICFGRLKDGVNYVRVYDKYVATENKDIIAILDMLEDTKCSYNMQNKSMKMVHADALAKMQDIADSRRNAALNVSLL